MHWPFRCPLLLVCIARLTLLQHLKCGEGFLFQYCSSLFAPPGGCAVEAALLLLFCLYKEEKYTVRALRPIVFIYAPSFHLQNNPPSGLGKMGTAHGGKHQTEQSRQRLTDHSAADRRENKLTRSRPAPLCSLENRTHLTCLLTVKRKDTG